MFFGCVAALDAASVSFSGQVVLRDISLCLKPGTLCIIGGPSGCGKSTLLRVLWGAVRPARGTARAGDADLTSASPTRVADWRRQIGIFSPDFPLAFDWTAFDNLFAVFCTTKAIPRERATERVTRELHRWGLLHQRHALARYLAESGRTRLALGRAFIRRPVAAFLDEPLIALPEGEHSEIINEVRLAAALGTAVVVATANWERWSPFADELYLIEDGRLRRLHDAQPVAAGSGLGAVQEEGPNMCHSREREC